jgi:hypothetical protein
MECLGHGKRVDVVNLHRCLSSSLLSVVVVFNFVGVPFFIIYGDNPIKIKRMSNTASPATISCNRQTF